jgi:predicted glycoside hydrolase/deacetylase ChbG (UPF0249 family)
MAAGRTQILITADDFGWTDGHNQAVERAATAGTLNRASLLCNGGAFAEAVAVARRCAPGLGVGVHLTLCEGRPLGPAAPLGELCRADGEFHDGLLPLVRSYAARRLPVAAIRDEWRRQLERALLAGLPLSHLDGHKHVHALPPLLTVAVELATEYRVPYLRAPAAALSRAALRRAPAWLVIAGLGARARRIVRAAGLLTCDHFVGFAESGGLTVDHLVTAIGAAGPGLTEIMTHPAVRTPAVQALGARYSWARRYRFEDELAALSDPRVLAALAALRSAG